MRFFVSLVLLLAAVGPAVAAPIWVERRFIPDATLVDPAFATFAAETSTVVDHSAWDTFLGDYLVLSEDGVNRVRYRAVTPDHRAALDAYIDALQAIDVAALSREDALAFWINLYNAATVQAILTEPDVSSIRDIGGVWQDEKVAVNGVNLALGDIEHGIVRPAFDDPRIHYALNCASIGCPNLAAEAYSGETVEAMLEAAARDYVNHPRGVRVSKGKVAVSKIYGWYREDFGADEKAVLDHIRQFAGPDLKNALAGADDIDDYEYDWSLNVAE